MRDCEVDGESLSGDYTVDSYKEYSYIILGIDSEVVFLSIAVGPYSEKACIIQTKLSNGRDPFLSSILYNSGDAGIHIFSLDIPREHKHCELFWKLIQLADIEAATS